MGDTATDFDVEHLKSWIGRDDVVSDLITEDLARKYYATLDLPGEPPRLGEPVPRGIHFCLGQPARRSSELGPDGHLHRGGFLPPVPLPRRMWAGGELVFSGDLIVGDAIRRTSRIEDVVLKHGQTGALCFVTVRHVIETNGRLVIAERQDIVYRPIEGSRATLPPVAPQGRCSRDIDVTASVLFRYSALTFNAHRIHYDRRYATEVEGYPGLVVHGPLQAALLLGYAGTLRGNPPTRFSFRGRMPVFDDDLVVLHAEETDGMMKLWSARKGGPIAMSAEAAWG